MWGEPYWTSPLFICIYRTVAGTENPGNFNKWGQREGVSKVLSVNKTGPHSLINEAVTFSRGHLVKSHKAEGHRKQNHLFKKQKAVGRHETEKNIS